MWQSLTGYANLKTFENFLSLSPTLPALDKYQEVSDVSVFWPVIDHLVTILGQDWSILGPRMFLQNQNIADKLTNIFN